MKNQILFILLTFGIVSCNNSTNEVSAVTNLSKSKSTSTNSTQQNSFIEDTLPEMPAEISERVNSTIDFPYLLNQDAINKLKLSDNRLTQKEVKLLSQYLITKQGFSDIESRLDSYFYYNQLIDSIGEEAYNNQIDLGMTQYFDAYLHDRVNLTKKKYLLIWSLDYGTYEACPFYAGQYVLATMCVDGKVSNTVFIGEDSGGGDPPYMSSVFAGSDVWDTYIDVKLFEEHTEDSEMSGEEMDYKESRKSKCRFLITENNIILDK